MLGFLLCEDIFHQGLHRFPIDVLVAAILAKHGIKVELMLKENQQSNMTKLQFDTTF